MYEHVQRNANIKICNIELQTLWRQTKFNKKNVENQNFNNKNSIFDSKRHSLYAELSKED